MASPNTSTELILDTSDLVINKSHDDLQMNMNNFDIVTSKQPIPSQEDKLRFEIEELNKLEVEQLSDFDLNLNGRFEAELEELNLTHLHLHPVKDNNTSQSKSNIKNVTSLPNVLGDITTEVVNKDVNEKHKNTVNRNEDIKQEKDNNRGNIRNCDDKEEMLQQLSTTNAHPGLPNHLNLRNSSIANESFNVDSRPINQANLFLKSNCDIKSI